MNARGFDAKAMAGKVPAPSRRVDLLVVGAGPAGVAAAIEAAKAGVEVLLVDENPVSAGLMGLDTPLYFGGRYSAAVQNKGRMLEQVFAANPALEEAIEAGVEVELGVYVWGAFAPGDGLASLPECLAGVGDEERAWMVGFRRLILATGARDVALSFKGWDQPGVMGARGFGALLETYDAFAGRRLAILGSGALALETARLALARGLEVAALIEARPDVQADPVEIAALGVAVLTGHVPAGAASGIDGLEGLTVRDLASGEETTLVCDTVVQAISLTPLIELLNVLGADLAMTPRLGGHAPASPDGVSTSLPGVFIAGDLAGVPGGAGGTPEAAAESGRRAARAALGSADEGTSPVTDGFDAVAYQQDWMRALLAVADGSVIVCQCEEVSREALLAVRQPTYLGPPTDGSRRRDLSGLLRDGPANLDQIKRLTRACMGPCQARRCREQVALTVACASGVSAADIPLAGYRAPVRPLPLAVLAEPDEHRDITRLWDVWFGIRGQWAPYEDIGTDREHLNADLLGGDMHA